MEVLVISRETGAVCKPTQLGKIFVRSPYCVKTTLRQRKDGWIFSGYMGFVDNDKHLQVIDYYCNFIKCSKSFISKTLVETVLLSHHTVARAVVMKNPVYSITNLATTESNKQFQSNEVKPHFQAFVTAKNGQTCSEEVINHYLNCMLLATVII